MKRKVYKKDFTIAGHFTGSQLQGREHEYHYHIYFNGRRINKYGFTSKAAADRFLGHAVAWINKQLEQKESMK